MTNNRISAIITATSLLLLSGCASMFNVGTQEIHAISSDGRPVSAKVIHNLNIHKTTLPTKIVTRPSSFHNIKIEIDDPCYAKSTTLIDSSVTSSYYANLLNMHGFYIDYLTGYMWEYPKVKTIMTSANLEKSQLCEKHLEKLQTSKVNNETVYLTMATHGKHAFGFGFLPNTVNHEKNYEADGFYFQYQYALNEQWRIQFRSIDMSLGCDDEYSSSSWCTAGSSPYTEQDMLTVGFNYYPFGGNGMYVGFGVGRLSIQQDFTYVYNYSNNTSPTAETAPSSNAEVAPIYVDLGYDFGRSFRFKIFGSISTSKLGLGSPIVLEQHDYTDQISDPDLRHKTKALFHEAKTYSALGAGFEFHY